MNKSISKAIKKETRLRNNFFKNIDMKQKKWL